MNFYENQIFMCCHNKYSVVPPLCIPIQGGRAINPEIAGITGDNTGDNISHKNKEYCELTVQYYAWKNITCDAYGFCHYRRFFCFNDAVKKPYLALGKMTEKHISKYLGTEIIIKQLLENYDIAVVRSEDMGITVQEHYNTSKYHYKQDLELFMDVLAEKAPHIFPFAEEYLGQNKQYFCNMFIMDRIHFDEYCSILFSVLKEFDDKKTLHGNFQSDRTDGYLAERFVGMYITYARHCGVRIKELPRIDADCGFKKRITYKLFPPESKRRFLLKKAIKFFKRNT